MTLGGRSFNDFSRGCRGNNCFKGLEVTKDDAYKVLLLEWKLIMQQIEMKLKSKMDRTNFVIINAEKMAE